MAARIVQVDETLLLRTAIAHARRRLGAWLEPEGMPAERCLDELLELFFHPALDACAAAEPVKDPLLEVLRQAVRDAREILLGHFGGSCESEGDRCLSALLLPLDNRHLVEAAGLPDLFTLEYVEERAAAMLAVTRHTGRLPTLH